jgi:hypothetical protein
MSRTGGRPGHGPRRRCPRGGRRATARTRRPACDGGQDTAGHSGRDIDDAVLAHIWPTHHENVHFYGTHSVDVAGELAKLGSDGYRPLRTATAEAQ